MNRISSLITTDRSMNLWRYCIYCCIIFYVPIAFKFCQNETMTIFFFPTKSGFNFVSREKCPSWCFFLSLLHFSFIQFYNSIPISSPFWRQFGFKSVKRKMREIQRENTIEIEVKTMKHTKREKEKKRRNKKFYKRC